MPIKNRIILSVSPGLFSGILFVFLFPGGKWWVTVLTTTVLTAGALFLLLTTVDWLGGDRSNRQMTLTAFFLRFGIGIFLMAVLPLWGYDTDQQNAGYLFKDAFVRDTASWQLAGSSEPLRSVFDSSFFEDQYGGLSLISSFVYRFFSPDLHRPYLVLILAAYAFAQGVPFFQAAVQKRWNPALAALAGWLLVVYPEGIFFSVSQMREPFIIGCGMILFWGVAAWFSSRKRRTIFGICLPVTAVMLLISWRAGMGVLLLIGLWWWIENIRLVEDQRSRRRHWLAMAAVLLLGVIGVLLVAGDWLRYTIWWDMHEMSLTSGWLEILNQGLPVPAQYAVTTIFGVLQVVLPSAVIETSIPLWKTITILRSVGWYLMLPLLIAGFVLVWNRKDRKERWIWMLFLLMSWGWILFSSLRAGGDLWDNPRYRMIYLPWLALLAAYFWQQRNHWFWRVLGVEGFALLGFTYWYLCRYIFFDWVKLPIQGVIASILVAAAAVGAHGVYMEWHKSQHPSSTDES